MRFRYAALLLSLACATPGTTYNKGTYAPPPPAPTRPGVGLPQPHMPGQHVGPKVEPNPRPRRPLPPTPGPGIWASETPTSAPSVVVKGVIIPLPQDVPVPDAERARACAQGASATLDLPHSDLGSVLRGKSPPVADMRNCTAFLAWHKCMTSKMWPLATREGAMRLADYAWEHFKKDPNRCHKWATARAESLALFENDLLSWFTGNYGRRQ